MEMWHAIVLGIVQGLTEFLPISSSGHLVLTGELLGVGTDENSKTGIIFAVSVHVGTLLSVLIYFHKRIIAITLGIFSTNFNQHHKTVLLLIIATIPAVIVGLTLKDQIKAAFASAVFTSCMLITTGAILFLPRILRRARPSEEDGEGDVGILGSIVMGIGQAFAILPGISRSGSTITAGMLAKVNPSKAAEFSFLMAIPAILGGAVFEFKDLLEFNEKPAAAEVSNAELASPATAAVAEPEPSKSEGLGRDLLIVCSVGALVAFITGLIAVYWVLDSIRRGKFEYFALYCFLIGVFGVIYFGFINPETPS